MRPAFSRIAAHMGAAAAIAFAAISVPALRAAENHRDAALFSAAAYLKHITYLASDELAGRGIGTPGIDEAARYIADQFESLGVAPAGTDGYFQPFTVSVNSRIGDNTRLAVRGEDRSILELNRDYVPMPFSKKGSFDGPVVFVGYGIDDPDDKKYNDYEDVDVKGKVVMMLRYQPAWWSQDDASDTQAKPRADKPDSEKPVPDNTDDNDRPRRRPNRPRDRSSPHAYFMTKAGQAIKHGAKAILVVDPAPLTGKAPPEKLYDFNSGRSPGVAIPMMNITRRAADDMLAEADLPTIRQLQRAIEKHKSPASIELKGVSVNGYVDIEKQKTPVKNVIGLIRGKGPLADEYVVVGAHYDHLGITRNWRKPNDTNLYIHNGADDNASGTIGLITLAQALKAGPPLKRSVILMAFTGEESGLLGSKHWVDHPTVPIKSVVAMINMDMIGRLKNDVLQVGGMGTGSGFKDMVEKFAERYDLKIHNGGGGRGPSDHSSFYGANIPVLFFFTGMHPQYHAPDDDVELINAEGACRVTHLVADILDQLADADDRPEFKKDSTRFSPEQQIADAKGGKPAAKSPHDLPAGAADDAMPAMPRVRLGIAPGNYGEAEGRGFPIEYVVEGGPAERAGLRDKDRIIRIGDREISDIGSYMSALSRYRPGDKIKIVVLRGDEEKTFTVQLDESRRSRDE